MYMYENEDRRGGAMCRKHVFWLLILGVAITGCFGKEPVTQTRGNAAKTRSQSTATSTKTTSLQKSSSSKSKGAIGSAADTQTSNGAAPRFGLFTPPKADVPV